MSITMFCRQQLVFHTPSCELTFREMGSVIEYVSSIAFSCCCVIRHGHFHFIPLWAVNTASSSLQSLASLFGRYFGVEETLLD